MSDLQSIVGEIDKIMQESKKTPVFVETDNTTRQAVPTMEEISATVAGVVMEEFPAGGDPEMFGHALVEAALGASEDMDIPPAEILAGVVTFFHEAISSARVIAEGYQVDDIGENDEGGDEDEDDHTKLDDKLIKVFDGEDDDLEPDDDEDDDEPAVSEAYGDFNNAFPDMGLA